MISACSSQQQVPQEKTSTELENIEQEKIELEPHWQLSYFDEPVFNSKVAVLEAGDKNNPPVILIHGLGNLGMKDWFSIIPTLEKKYHVIAMDLPGFGLSSTAKGRFLPTNYAHVVDSIIEQYTDKKVIVMGHSMGGAVALRYTELFENSVQQLILVDVAGLLEKSVFIKHIASFEFGDDISIPMKFLMERVNSISSSMIESGTKSNFISNFMQSNDYVWNLVVSDSSNMNAALSLVEEDFNHAVNHISVPINIIWGSKDAVAPLRTGKVLNKKMKSVRLQVIEEAGHVPMKSNYSEFMHALDIALNNPIIEKDILRTAEKNKGTLTCLKESNKSYSGHYEKIKIDNCKKINLTNITTSSLEIRRSVVTIENLNFSHAVNSIDIVGSVVTITNADITGHELMLISGSRVDMAGVSIKATGDAIMIGNGSRISASFCDIDSPKYTGAAHGAFYRRHQALIE
jgi:pimeloyl-ACP methyl ester carboxylesterase